MRKNERNEGRKKGGRKEQMNRERKGRGKQVSNHERRERKIPEMKEAKKEEE